MLTTALPKYSFKRSFLRGEFFSVSWEGAERLVSAVNVFLMLRLLSLYEFGVYQLVLAFFTLVTTFSVDSIHEVTANDLARYLREGETNRYRRLFSEYAFLRVVLGAITALAVFLLADLISVRYGQHVEAYLKIIAFLFLLEGFRRPLFAILKTHLFFGFTAFQPLLVAVVKLAGFLTLIQFGLFNIGGVLVAHIVGYLVSTVVMIAFFTRHLGQALVLDIFHRGWVVWEIAKRYGKWAVVGEQVSRFTQSLRPWLIQFYVGTEAVAVFNLSLSLAGMLSSFLPVRTFSALIPRELADRQKLKFIYANSVKFIGLAGLILAAGAVLVFPPLISLILPKYVASFPYFRWQAFIILPFAGFTILTRAILVALREQRVLFTRPLLQLIPTLALSFLLLPRFGLWGAVAEHAFTSLFLGYVLYRYLRWVRPELALQPAVLFRLGGNDFQFIKENAISSGRELVKKLKAKLGLKKG